MTDQPTYVVTSCPVCLSPTSRIQYGVHVSPVRCGNCATVQRCYHCAPRTHPRNEVCLHFGRPRKVWAPPSGRRARPHTSGSETPTRRTLP